MTRHAWLQKHPSPQAAGGEFHWYPDMHDGGAEPGRRAGAPGDRELRASFVERMRGVEPPAVLWQLERGRVAWGQVFAATAPIDGRRYVGLVLSVVESERPTAELLAMLVPPRPVPWTSGMETATRERRAAIPESSEATRARRAGTSESSSATRARRAGTSESSTATRARSAEASESNSATHGRSAGASESSEATRARRAGTSESSGATRDRSAGASESSRAMRDRSAGIPESSTAMRDRNEGMSEPSSAQCAMRGDVAGVIRALISGGAAMVDDPADRGLPRAIASLERLVPDAGPRPRCGVWCASAVRGPRDRVAELGALAWGEPGSRAAAAWTLLCELAQARGESIDHVGAALDAIDTTAVLTEVERAQIGSGASVVDVLHAWGRGRFDRSAAAGTLATRLAELVALRVLVRLAAGDDARGAIAEARWYALLSAQRRTALLAAVASRTVSLRRLVEASHG